MAARGDQRGVEQDADKSSVLRQFHVLIKHIKGLKRQITTLLEEIENRRHRADACLCDAKARTEEQNHKATRMMTELRRRQAGENKRIGFLRKTITQARTLKKNWPAGQPSPSGGVSASDITRLMTRLKAAGPSPSSTFRDVEARVTQAGEAAQNIRRSLDLEREELKALKAREKDIRSGVAGIPVVLVDAAATSVRLRQLRAQQCHMRETCERESILVADRLRLEHAWETVARQKIDMVQKALGASEARLSIFKDAIAIALATVYRLSVQPEERKGAAQREVAQVTTNTKRGEPADVTAITHAATTIATAAAAIFSSAPSPAEGVNKTLGTWETGQFYNEAVYIARTGGNEDSVFVAAEVLNVEKNWAKVEKILGEGGFGTVRQIVVPTLSTRYALKTCKLSEGDDGNTWNVTALARLSLLTEMLVHSRLPWHANIVQALAMDDRNAAQMSILYELGESDFEDYAWGRASASTTETARLLTDVAVGLEHLCANGYSHNDLKPANILIFSSASGGRPTAKLADLGLALALGEVRNGEGTSGYMPPEAMLGMKVKSHSNQEVFSFAHLLWLTFSKQEFKQYNMFLGKEGRTEEDFRIMKGFSAAENRTSYLERMTFRNMTDFRYRDNLLKPEYMSDDLGDVRVNFLDTVNLALSKEPQNRPTLHGMVNYITIFCKVLTASETNATVGDTTTTATTVSTSTQACTSSFTDGRICCDPPYTMREASRARGGRPLPLEQLPQTAVESTNITAVASFPPATINHVSKRHYISPRDRVAAASHALPTEAPRAKYGTLIAKSVLESEPLVDQGVLPFETGWTPPSAPFVGRAETPYCSGGEPCQQSVPGAHGPPQGGVIVDIYGERCVDVGVNVGKGSEADVPGVRGGSLENRFHAELGVEHVGRAALSPQLLLPDQVRAVCTPEASVRLPAQFAPHHTPVAGGTSTQRPPSNRRAANAPSMDVNGWDMGHGRTEMTGEESVRNTGVPRAIFMNNDATHPAPQECNHGHGGHAIIEMSPSTAWAGGEQSPFAAGCGRDTGYYACQGNVYSPVDPTPNWSPLSPGSSYGASATGSTGFPSPPAATSPAATSRDYHVSCDVPGLAVPPPPIYSGVHAPALSPPQSMYTRTRLPPPSPLQRVYGEMPAPPPPPPFPVRPTLFSPAAAPTGGIGGWGGDVGDAVGYSPPRLTPLPPMASAMDGVWQGSGSWNQPVTYTPSSCCPLASTNGFAGQMDAPLRHVVGQNAPCACLMAEPDGFVAGQEWQGAGVRVGAF